MKGRGMMYGQTGNGVDIATLVLLALGFGASGIEFMGGLALGLAGAFTASRIIAAGMVKNAKPLGVFGTVVTGIFVSIMVALTADHYLPSMPIQLPMAAGGFLSSFIAPLFLKVASSISQRSDRLADRAINRVFPPDE